MAVAFNDDDGFAFDFFVFVGRGKLGERAALDAFELLGQFQTDGGWAFAIHFKRLLQQFADAERRFIEDKRMT